MRLEDGNDNILLGDSGVGVGFGLFIRLLGVGSHIVNGVPERELGALGTSTSVSGSSGDTSSTSTLKQDDYSST